MSMYKGQRKFDKEQLIFVVECILIGALDRLENLADDFDDERSSSLELYEKGALEGAGMALGVFYAQLTDDGLGIYDALVCADDFHLKLENLVKQVKLNIPKFKIRRKELKGRSYQLVQDYFEVVIPGVYPDTRKHAECFVENCFEEYLVNSNKYKFRAECSIDVERLENVIPSKFNVNLIKQGFPDVEVEFDSYLSLSEIIDLMKTIEDGHVMYETVKPIEQYTGQRIPLTD